VGVRALSNRHRAVFFDRDGVLVKAIVRNGLPFPAKLPSELEFEPGVRESLLRLRESVDSIFVVSNQPDVARGTQTRAANELLNERIASELPIKKFYTCYHDDADRCDCRKPLPGLLRRAADEFGIDLSASYLVGDRWRDIDAGAAAGCQTILIDRGYQERAPSNAPDKTFSTTAEAIESLLDELRRENAVVMGEL
jgi:D-glycero-D-manno-heptose 1,7-bisphosphate phosphatase